MITAKNVIRTTELTKPDKRGLGRIIIGMLVQIKLDGTPIIVIARMCGCAPCQILAVNNVKYETDLVQGSIINVPVVTKHLITSYLK